MVREPCGHLQLDAGPGLTHFQNFWLLLLPFNSLPRGGILLPGGPMGRQTG